MNFITALIAGLLIGWLAEWLIDWFYWRNRLAAQEQAVHDAKAAETEAREKVANLEARLDAIQTASAAPSAPLDPPTIARRPDDLTKIKGIGPVIAKKLNAAGIMTYQQLGRLSTEEFEEIMGDLLQRFVNENSILDQANELSQKKAE